MLTKTQASLANIVPAVNLPESLKHLIGEIRGTKAPCLTEVSVDTPMDISQRDFKESDVVRYISKSDGLDWNLFGYVTVVENPKTKQRTMINGQHRTSIVKTLAPSVKTVPAHIISTDDPQYAAKLFAYLNGVASRNVSPEQLLWAEVLAGDPRALEIEQDLIYCNLACGKVNLGSGRKQVSRATFVKCIKLGKEATSNAVELISNAYPNQESFDNLLHGTTHLLAHPQYRGLSGKNTLGKKFKDWFVNQLPLAFTYRESTKIVPRRDPWQYGIAYGLYGKFYVYMNSQGLKAHCPAMEPLKLAYKNGDEDQFE